LISLGILTIGLLGVAAIFPVGSYYLQKGEIADRGSAIAQAAFNDAITRGVLNPANWREWQGTQIVAWSTTINVTNTDRQLFRTKLVDRMNQLRATLATQPAATQRRSSNIGLGSVFVIDPIAAASVTPVSNPVVTPLTFNTINSILMSKFPATSFRLDPSESYYNLTDPTGQHPWQAWYTGTASSLTNFPVRRVTIDQSQSATMMAAVADKLFSSSDDLALDIPPAASKPSVQRYEIASADLNGDGNSANDPLARQARGDYSWVITVAPTTAEAYDALATDPSSYEYEVSVVVFYKRPVPKTTPQTLQEFNNNVQQQIMPNERMVLGKVVSTGLNGGQLLLETVERTGAPPESPYALLKEGNWMMVTGPHPNSTDDRPLLVSRWYRVTSISGKDRRLNGLGTENPPPPNGDPERRLVSLRGPEWPWQPVAPADGGLTASNQLSNYLCVGLFRGAVAVHSRTVRLDASALSSGGSVTGTTLPTGLPGYVP
jgi:hypothetical protein